MKPVFGDPFLVAWLRVLDGGRWIPSLCTAIVHPVCVNIRQDGLRLI